MTDPHRHRSDARAPGRPPGPAETSLDVGAVARGRAAPAQAREPIFELADVGVAYGGNAGRARHHASTSRKHEITALIGPSGCGKSTLMRCLNRMNDLIPAPTVERRDPLPRRGPLRRRRRPGRGAQADRDGVPEAEPVPEVDLRQHRLRPARARHEGRHGRDRRARAAARRALGRGQGPAQGERLRHVRRPAAAPLHRPRARDRARRDPDGRAVLGARPDLDRPDRGPDARAARSATRSSSSRTTCSRPRASRT